VVSYGKNRMWRNTEERQAYLDHLITVTILYQQDPAIKDYENGSDITLNIKLGQ
jgi:hypothetical protein